MFPDFLLNLFIRGNADNLVKSSLQIFFNIAEDITIAYINGKPDLIVINGEKRIALEIETGNSDVLGNIEKNLKAGFDEIICVATNKEVEQKIREQLGVSDERVRVTSVFEFDVS